MTALSENDGVASRMALMDEIPVFSQCRAPLGAAGCAGAG